MSELKTCVEATGFENVSTYINSGNVFFDALETDERKVAKKIEKAIEKTFNLPVRVVVLSKAQLARIIAAMPAGWGTKEGWKYNTLFVFPPYTATQVMEAIGPLKDDIEIALPGEGVVLQAVEFKAFSRSAFSKIVATPIYKQVTVRNLNTTRKLQELING